jgi:hypothetical protein
VHFREIPFLRLFVPLCAGVIMAEYSHVPVTVSWIAVAAALVIMTLRVGRKSYFTDVLFGMALTFFLFFSGCLLRLSEKGRLSELEESRQQIMIRISEYPEKVNNGWSFQAKIITVRKSDRSGSPKGSLLLYLMTDTLLSSLSTPRRKLSETMAIPASLTIVVTWKVRV